MLVLISCSCFQEPVLSPTVSFSESSCDEGVITVRCASKVQPFDVNKFSVSSK